MRPRLDRSAIIAVAAELIQERGVDAFTTRLLADRLGVKQPALYWHFPSKTALLDQIATDMLVLGHPRSVPRAEECWADFLEENAHSFRRALRSLRDGAKIHAAADPEDTGGAAASAQLAFLEDHGFGEAHALSALIALSRYTVGAVLEEQASTDWEATTAPRIAGRPWGWQAPVNDLEDDRFSFGLSVFLAGLAGVRNTVSGAAETIELPRASELPASGALTE